MSISKEKIDSLLDKADELENEFNEKILHELLNTIDKKFEENIFLRKKFKEDFNKYISIEESLNEDITYLNKIGAYPNLIKNFIDFEGIKIFSKLLTHPNSDLINTVIILIQEITEEDYLNELPNKTDFLELFISNNILDLLVDNLFKIYCSKNENDNFSKEKDFYQYINDILSVIENFTDNYPHSVDLLGENKQIFSFLLNFLQDFFNNFSIEDLDKQYYIDTLLYITEILELLLQFSIKNKTIFAEIEGLPKIIFILSKFQTQNFKFFKGKNFCGMIEELISNLFNCVCSCLLEEKNKKIFNMSDGIKMMIDCMKNNNCFRFFGLKVLNFALQNDYDNSNHFIDSNGLSLLFSFFIGKKIQKISNYLKGEDYCVEIILNLFKYSSGIQRQRLIYKFSENNYEKLQRLIQYYLLEKFLNKKDKVLNQENENYSENVYIFNSICVLIRILYCESQEFQDNINILLQKYKIDLNLDIMVQVKSMYNEIGDEIIENSLKGNESSQNEEEQNQKNFNFKKFLETLL